MLAHLVVVGFQELDLSAEAFILNDSPREAYYAQKVSTSLPGYVKLLSKQLAGLLLLVYVHPTAQPFVSPILTDSVGCGVLGMGNKGAVLGNLFSKLIGFGKGCCKFMIELVVF